jgi:hypothetical protein
VIAWLFEIDPMLVARTSERKRAPIRNLRVSACAHRDATDVYPGAKLRRACTQQFTLVVMDTRFRGYDERLWRRDLCAIAPWICFARARNDDAKPLFEI